MKADIGLIGLAVMGENIALNMEGKGFTVALYNRNAPGEEEVVNRFMRGRGIGRRFVGAHSIEQFVGVIERPRKILLMVKAGKPVDELIAQLVPYLSSGDVIIDGGNSDFHDTERRVRELEERGFYFIGAGISGGEEGALHGPSIMPGGSELAWPLVEDFLQRIAAKLEDGTPCCEWIGGGGAGHFVKMVHNGIEYGDMQLIAETYQLLKLGKGLDNDTLADLFEEWNQGELNSYLIEITAHILRYRDKDGRPLLSKILDVAQQKGTGKWSVMAALNEREPFSLIAEAVYARFLSALLVERKKMNRLYGEPVIKGLSLSVDSIHHSLYLSKLICYAQGFSLLYRASAHYGWDLDLGVIAKIWQNGCIIRSAFLREIMHAFHQNPRLENLLFDTFFQSKIQSALSAWREVVAMSILNGIAIPAMSAALSYFDGLRTFHSAANLIQAQRDYFGAHLYERVDCERGHFFHTNWTGESKKYDFINEEK